MLTLNRFRSSYSVIQNGGDWNPILSTFYVKCPKWTLHTCFHSHYPGISYLYFIQIQKYHKRDVINNLDMKFHDSVTILVSHNNMKSIELLDPLHPVNYSKKFGQCPGCT